MKLKHISTFSSMLPAQKYMSILLHCIIQLAAVNSLKIN